MQAITIPKHSKPDAYELTSVPKPAITSPDEILIKVHAASINPVDVKKADGAFKMALTDTYVPYRALFLRLV